MKFKAGDFVKFKNFRDMPNKSRYNRESRTNDFHKNHEGIKMKIYKVRGSKSPDPRVTLEGYDERFQFRTERFVQYNMGIELDDNLFQI